ncbi:MAG: hypothetical protein WD830_02555 [Chloroflexota bacterium]
MLSRLLRPRYGAAIAVACMALAALPAVAAADDQAVSVSNCSLSQDGETTVQAGNSVILQWSWGARTKGLVIAAVKAIEQTVTVDDADVADVDSYWGSPVPVNDPTYGSVWIATWSYQAGVLADPGDTMDVTVDGVLTHPIVDLVLFDGNRPMLFGPLDFVWDCEITAV